jgi:2-polyprenyl-3-methyl-5-hydroxy-6-metoxy-1,4-benzoquinol methylase
LEPDEGARAVASEKYNIQLGSPESLFKLPSAQFDVITMWHVLEHVHQLHEYLEQIKRLLKEDGIALIALPNYTSADASITVYGGPHTMCHVTFIILLLYL